MRKTMIAAVAALIAAPAVAAEPNSRPDGPPPSWVVPANGQIDIEPGHPGQGAAIRFTLVDQAATGQLDPADRYSVELTPTTNSRSGLISETTNGTACPVAYQFVEMTTDGALKIYPSVGTCSDSCYSSTLDLDKYLTCPPFRDAPKARWKWHPGRVESVNPSIPFLPPPLPPLPPLK